MDNDFECDEKVFAPKMEQDSFGDVLTDGNDGLKGDAVEPKDEGNSLRSPIGCQVTEGSTQESKLFESENQLDAEALKQMAEVHFHDSVPNGTKINDIIHSESLSTDEAPLSAVSSRDSGGNDKDEKGSPHDEEKDDFVPPSDELMDKIIKQVESYFTDFNIMKDSFLLKHVRRNKEGYISLKLISSFRRVKTLTKDWRVVRYSLQRSTKLQVNAEGTKIRRTQPVPNFEETSCAKTVLVFNLPSESATVQIIHDMMSKYGDVAEVNIVTPGSDIPIVCTKRCLSFYNDFSNKTFALVQFKEYDSAVVAMKGQEKMLENELKIVPLLSDVYKTKVLSASPKKGSRSPKSASSESDQADKKSNNGKRRPHRNRTRVDEIKASDSSSSSPDSFTRRKFSPKPKAKSPNMQPEKDSVQCFSKSLSQNASPVSKPDAFPKPYRARSNLGEIIPEYPCITKRYNVRNGVNQLNQSNKHLLPENVIRHPRGPDGTSGFHNRWAVPPEPHPTVTTNITDVIKNFIATH